MPKSNNRNTESPPASCLVQHERLKGKYGTRTVPYGFIVRVPYSYHDVGHGRIDGRCCVCPDTARYDFEAGGRKQESFQTCVQTSSSVDGVAKPRYDCLEYFFIDFLLEGDKILAHWSRAVASSAEAVKLPRRDGVRPVKRRRSPTGWRWKPRLSNHPGALDLILRSHAAD